ncbi:hypothetical protein LguiA_033281 [Lonicera macranthoides]
MFLMVLQLSIYQVECIFVQIFIFNSTTSYFELFHYINSKCSTFAMIYVKEKKCTLI